MIYVNLCQLLLFIVYVYEWNEDIITWHNMIDPWNKGRHLSDLLSHVYMTHHIMALQCVIEKTDWPHSGYHSYYKLKRQSIQRSIEKATRNTMVNCTNG